MGTLRSNSDRFVTCRYASDYMGVSDDTIRRWVRAGFIEGVRVGRRCLRVRESSLIAYANAKVEGGAK